VLKFNGKLFTWESISQICCGPVALMADWDDTVAVRN